MHQPPEAVEVLLHVGGIDQELLDQPGEAHQREVERHGGVRPDHAFGRGVRDIALVPKRYVFHRRHRIGAHHAGEPGEVFRQHRVALVRHRRRTLLALGEELLGFQHLGALQMADFDREPLDRGGDHAERRKIHRVAVARDYLGRDRLGHQPHCFRNMFFDARVDLGKSADGA